MIRQWTGIICGASLVLLSACGGTPGGSQSTIGVPPDVPPQLGSFDGTAGATTASGPTANIAESQKTMDENPGMDWATASNLTIERKLGWDKLPDGAKSSDLPANLDGVVLYGNDGSEVKCFSAGKATLQTPQDTAPIDATYVTGTSGLTLTYLDNGKESTIEFAAQRIGRKINLNVQRSTMPKLPSVLKGTLKE